MRVTEPGPRTAKANPWKGLWIAGWVLLVLFFVLTVTYTAIHGY